MRQSETQEMISLLICKQLTGDITSEEQLVLDEWRKQNEWNEAAYQRLMDTDRLHTEYLRSQMADYHRPLSDMKRRLFDTEDAPTMSTRKSFLSPRFSTYIAVAATLLLLVGSIVFFRAYQQVRQETSRVQMAKADILPGRTQAMLTLADGKTVELGADQTLNTEAINKARQQTGGLQQSTPNTLSTPRGGEFKVTLEDGTEVWLNAESTLRYPEAFDGDERRVELAGEAYFKVAKNTEKPFYVVSGGQEVRVYGTEFNVHAYGDEPAIFTTLVEGSISLRPLTGNKSELMLTPGNQSVFNRSDATARVHKVDTDVVTSWRNGVFVFEDQTMEQIMRTLSRWYDFTYEFVDQQVAQTEFMGSIPRYGSFSEVAEIFQKLGGIKLRQQGNHIILSAKN